MIYGTASPTSGAAGTGSSPLATSGADIQDRFLKLLVAQLNNQDPMNPMDNAQMTTQMAQINTVTGIQQVNESLKGMADQFTSLQMMQGLSMVGRDVMVKGDGLARNASGTGAGGFELGGKADAVKVEILSPSNQVIDTINLGAKEAGRHNFSWDGTRFANTVAPKFRVTATQGKEPVKATALALDKVVSIGQDNGTMSVRTQSGKNLAYADIRSIY